MRGRSPHLFTHTLVTYTHHFQLRQHTYHYTYKCVQYQHLSGSAYTPQTAIAMTYIPTNKPLSVYTKQDILQPTDHPRPVLHSNQQAFIRLDQTGPTTHVLQICTPHDFYTRHHSPLFYPQLHTWLLRASLVTIYLWDTKYLCVFLSQDQDDENGLML